MLKGSTVVGLRPGDVVELITSGKEKGRDVSLDSASRDKINAADLYFAKFDDVGNVSLIGTKNVALSAATLLSAVSVQRLTLTITAGIRGQRADAYSGLSTAPTSANFIATVLRNKDPSESTARVWFAISGDETEKLNELDFASLMIGLITARDSVTGVTGGLTLRGGDDGHEPNVADYEGTGVDVTATGLLALADVDDIAIVAAPAGATHTDKVEQQAIRGALITHCENLHYRFAILSADKDFDDAAIRSARSQHDSTYAGLYYPWVTIPDPFSESGELLDLPPDGFAAGVYARSDIERGVHKAPANEIVRGALRFSRNINKGIQDTLNPEGINCLRFFEGRGHRVWGARTISSDPEWMYVNVRRLFIYMEHSIDKSTQWCVFEPNNESLWLKVRLTIESFLLEVWRSGALMGAKPEDAFFVRCDRSTMTQSDLDNGRLIVLIGVAPTKPAEFVVFRIGQWTADASII